MTKKQRKRKLKQERKSPAWSKRNWKSSPYGAIYADNGTSRTQAGARYVELELGGYVELPRGGTKKNLPASKVRPVDDSDELKNFFRHQRSQRR
jgi:hypothetical protein